MASEQEDTGAAVLDTVEGWDDFSRDEQRFLLTMNNFNTEAQAAEYIGKSSRWITEHKSNNYLFKLAVMNTKENRTTNAFAARAAAGLLSKAISAYEYVLTQKNGKYAAPMSQVLAAATTVLKMNDPKADPDSQGTRVYASQVQMFQFNNAPKNLQEAATGDDEH